MVVTHIHPDGKKEIVTDYTWISETGGETLVYDDELLAWDFNSGTYVVSTPSLIEVHATSESKVISLKFVDGTIVKIAGEHGFFDKEVNNFVYIDERNVSYYVGHDFVKRSSNGSYETVQLVDYEITVENIAYYTIQTAIYNNCIAEDMFTLTSPAEMLDDRWFDYFEIGNDMKYDEIKMQEDIEKYGLYTYDDFAEHVTYEQFVAFNGPYLKVLVGKGIVTYEQILTVLNAFANSIISQ